MAIVKMKRVTLIAENRNKTQILDDLMWLSSVDISPLAQKLSDEKWAAVLHSDSDEKNSEKYLKNKEAINKAIEILAPYSTVKKSVFTKPYEISRQDFNDFEKNNKDVLYLASSVLDVQAQLNALKIQENKLRTLMQSLLVWKNYPFDLNGSVSKHVGIELGVVPTTVDMEAELPAIYEAAPACYIETINKDNEQFYVAVVFLKKDEDKVFSAMSPLHYAPVSFKDMDGTAEDNMMITNEQIEQAVEKREVLTKKLAEYAADIAKLETASDIIANNAQLYTVCERLLCTENTFMLEGWCPEKRVAELEEKLKTYDCYFEVNDPQTEEEPPVLLKNNAFATPFETITKMYALPTYRGLDPDFVMAPFFFILFGMMLGDLGYGLILTLGCAIGLKFAHFKKSMRQNLKMFMLCGISTMIWGLLFGSFFGNVIPLFSEKMLGMTANFRALWFNPMDAPLTLLILSFALGYIHIMAGLFMKMFMLLRDKRYLEAFFDVGFWILTLIGVVVFALGSILTSFIPPILGTIGMYMTFAGLAGLILTQGRDKKNPIAKLFGGIMSLYDITGYLSDVLSYSRVLALGLSTSVIAMVFNYLAVLVGGNFFGAIIFIVVFAIGTVLNLALSTLSAYVHSSRLQFIEFFSKFYESGGREFDALRIETKYSDIK